MNEYLTKCNKIYLDSLSSELSLKTLENKRKIIMYLMDYLDSLEITSFVDLDFTIIYRYINNSSWASHTKSTFQFTIRDFFNVMYQNNISNFHGRMVYPTIFTNKRDRVLSYFSTEEIKLIIDSIDIKKTNGVRNKCMITLAAQLGLRSSDIIYLKFEEINWDKQLIEKIQHKTKARVCVPLPLNVKFLLIDYIKNHRPKSNSEYVFIYKKTMDTYSATELYSILNIHMKKAGIDYKGKKHGPHALRHSLASNLLKDNTPMPIITGILGHKNFNTTTKYLSIDIETLRGLSLEVPADE